MFRSFFFFESFPKRLKKFFEWCKKNEYKPALYYTGHGEVGTGDWCFSDGTVS